jgi:hypothetical protein
VRIASVVWVVLVVACKSKGTADAPVPTNRPEPVIAIDVWPEHWERVADLWAREPDLGPRPASLWALAEQLITAVGFKAPALPPPGLDTSGPVTIELFGAAEPFESDAQKLVHVTVAGQPAGAAPSPWLRVTIPASDPAHMAEALRTGLHRDSGSDAPGLRVVAGGAAVAVDVALGAGRLGESFSPAVAPAFEPGNASAARAVVHVDRIGEISTTLAMAQLAGALGDVPADQKTDIVAAAIAEALSGYLLMDPASAFASEALVDLPADAKQPAHVALALTDGGSAIASAAGLARGKTAELSTLHWSAAIAAAPRSPLLEDAVRGKTGEDALTAITTLLHQCGPACFVYIAAPGNAFQFAEAIGSTSLLDQLSGVLGELDTAKLMVTWSDQDLVFLHAPGDTPPLAWKRTRDSTATAGDACYRRALIAVRTALEARAEGSASLEPATQALDGAASCTASDPKLAARRAAMKDLVTALAKP